MNGSHRADGSNVAQIVQLLFKAFLWARSANSCHSVIRYTYVITVEATEPVYIRQYIAGNSPNIRTNLHSVNEMKQNILDWIMLNALTKRIWILSS